MSLALGKRKRAVTSKTTLPSKKATLAKSAPPPPPAPEPESDAEDREALNEAFRRAFEKRFKAIEEDKPEEVEIEEEELNEDEDEDWDGLSEEDEDDEDEVEVVEHNMSNFSRERADKAALKAFMVTCQLYPKFQSQRLVTNTRTKIVLQTTHLYRLTKHINQTTHKKERRRHRRRHHRTRKPQRRSRPATPAQRISPSRRNIPLYRSLWQKPTQSH